VHVDIYLPFLVAALAGQLARPLAERLDPRQASWLLAGSAVLLAGCTTAALGMLTLVGLAGVPALARLGDLSPAAMRRHDPTSQLVALAAGLLLGAVLVGMAAVVWRRAGALYAAYRQARRYRCAGTVVVVSDPSPDAFTLPGRPGRIVVSTGMLAALTGAERRVLLAHERTHLRHRHHLFLAATRLATAASPLLWPLDTAVAYAVERWADETAARAVGDRRVAAGAVGKAALVRARAGRPGAAGTLGIGGALPGGAGPVPRRVAALLAGPPARQLPLVLGILAVLAATGLCTLEAATDARVLFELAQHR
jgi:Peptidase family M48